MRIFPKKLSKLNINLNPILHNQVLLYFITLVVIVDIFFVLNEKDIFSFIVFLLVGLLTSFFSKNMIVIFVVALTTMHILKYGNSAYVSEGFESKSDSDDSDNISDTDSVDDAKPVKGKNTDSKKNTVKDVSAAEEDTGKQEKIEYADLKKEYQDFQGIQDKILGALQEIDPLLNRAELFIKKFESYKEQNREKMQNINK